MSHTQQFALVLDETGRLLSTLTDALDAEHAAIIGNDPKVLTDTVGAKLALLAELERLLVARDGLQVGLGFAAGLDGAEQLLTQHAPRLETTWDEFIELCQSVERKNAANGLLVSQNSQQTRQVLALLTGRDAVDDGYTRSGESRGRVSGSSVGRV